MPDLNEHIASVHEGKKPFHCEMCDVQFELELELNEHIALVHEERNHFKVLSVKLSLIKCQI